MPDGGGVDAISALRIDGAVIVDSDIDIATAVGIAVFRDNAVIVTAAAIRVDAAIPCGVHKDITGAQRHRVDAVIGGVNVFGIPDADIAAARGIRRARKDAVSPGVAARPGYETVV